MKDKFNELFTYGIDFDSAGHNTLMQNRYDELGENQIEYIENATLNFADMYEMLEQSKEMLINIHRNTGSLGAKAKVEEIEQLLKRAGGEN
jgi:hypothetical protein